jgi:hypothetical protein
MIYYHGTNKLFDEFDKSYSLCCGKLYVSPCKEMSLSYIPRTGGYLYTLEIDDSNINFEYSHENGQEDCKCRAYSDVSNFKIIKVERVEKNGPVFKCDCGGVSLTLSRN